MQPFDSSTLPLAQLRPPGGTIDPLSRFYIPRLADRQALNLLARATGMTCTIKGPRQSGKSSLLLRLLEAGRRSERRTVMLDFTGFDGDDLSTATSFYRAFCTALARRLDIPVEIAHFWKRKLNNRQLCGQFLQTHILPHTPTGLILGMDEVDRIFDCDFGSDFFAMLRQWHNERAEGFWTNLDLVLVTSTEPYLFIKNLNQSPFNVAEIVEMTDFTPEEARELNHLHGDPIPPGLEPAIFELTGGHPYLTHLIVYCAVSGIHDPQQFLEPSDWANGPLNSHLSYFEFHLQEMPELAVGWQKILVKGRCEERVFHRLRGIGLASGTYDKARPRCELYRQYFLREFNK